MTQQVLIQKVTNGVIVSPVVQGQPGIDLSQIAVFTKMDTMVLAHIAKMLDQPLVLPTSMVTDPADAGTDEG